MNYIIVRLLAIAGIVQIVTTIGRRQPYRDLTRHKTIPRLSEPPFMLFSAGQRLIPCLLSVLACVSPPAAHGSDGPLVPVIEVTSDRGEATSRPLREPSGLIVAAEAVPLPHTPVVTGASLGRPRHNSTNVSNQLQRQPAVRFAAPFDPTKRTHLQRIQLLTEDPAPAATLAPVIRVYQPIRPASRTTPSSVLDPVRRSVFLATRTDRLQRTGAMRQQAFQRQDGLSTRLLATLDSFTRPRPTPSGTDRIVAQSAADARPSSVTLPQESGIIEIVELDSTSKTDAATEQPRRSTPLVVQSTHSPIGPLTRQHGDAADSGSPSNPPISRERTLDVADVLSHRPSGVVELAVNPTFDASSTIVPPAEKAASSLLSPVVELSEETLPARSIAQEDPSVTSLVGEPAKPVIQLAELKPLLAALQPSPSASDLPAPEEPAIAAEQTSEAEQIEASVLDFKPIGELSARTDPEAGELPTNYAAVRFAREGKVAHRMGFSRSTTETEVMWEAPAICHRPLYFEDLNLERHGSKVPLIQPAISAAHFFGRVPLVPYMMMSEGHRDCQYTLGHYRPGDYAPYSLYIPRFRLDASTAEAAVIAGIFFAFP